MGDLKKLFMGIGIMSIFVFSILQFYTSISSYDAYQDTQLIISDEYREQLEAIDKQREITQKFEETQETVKYFNEIPVIGGAVGFLINAAQAIGNMLQQFDLFQNIIDSAGRLLFLGSYISHFIMLLLIFFIITVVAALRGWDI